MDIHVTSGVKAQIHVYSQEKVGCLVLQKQVVLPYRVAVMERKRDDNRTEPVRHTHRRHRERPVPDDAHRAKNWRAKHQSARDV